LITAATAAALDASARRSKLNPSPGSRGERLRGGKARDPTNLIRVMPAKGEMRALNTTRPLHPHAGRPP
jgi:hypothetical protein